MHLLFLKSQLLLNGIISLFLIDNFYFFAAILTFLKISGFALRIFFVF